jgi:hypothetical protein
MLPLASAFFSTVESDPRSNTVGFREPLDEGFFIVDSQIVARRKIEAPSTDEESPTVRSEHLAGFGKREVRESIAHRRRVERSGGHFERTYTAFCGRQLGHARERAGTAGHWPVDTLRVRA